MVDTKAHDEAENSVPETNVLAIASHVVYGYVGNTMATFCMQTLGCDVAAINTVNFSNHTGYRQFTGPRTPSDDIKTLYQGLLQSHLTDFDVLLTGYIPSAPSLSEIAQIARDLKLKRETMRPGSFFWILDPVMGDQGRLYVSEEMVRGYKDVVCGGGSEVGGPDLVVPNGFELEVISGVCLSGDDVAEDGKEGVGGEEEGNGAELTRQPTGDNYEANLTRVKRAIQILHTRDNIPMVIVTSVRVQNEPGVLYVVGSERTSKGGSRVFTVKVPVLDCYFSGTGDMFAGLMVARLREACKNAGTLNNRSWKSDDDVPATELPLAKATVKVLSSMTGVLEKTMVARDEEMARFERESRGSVDVKDGGEGIVGEEDEEKRVFLARTKAAEVRAVRNARDLVGPEIRYEARAI